MSKFKKGDRVTCVNLTDGSTAAMYLTLGKEYEIKSVSIQAGWDGDVSLVGVANVFPGWSAHRFELVSEPANNFIVKVLSGIQVGSFCGTFPSSEEAQKYVTDSGMPGLTYQIFEMVPAVTLSVKEVRTRTVEQVTP